MNRACLLQFADRRFRSDKEFVMGFISGDGRALKHVSKELKDDEDILREAMKGCQWGSWPIEFASQKLRSNKELIMELIREILSS